MEITSALVDGGANVDKHEKRRGRTAFHCACVGGNKETVVYLSQTVKCRIGKCMCMHVSLACSLFYGEHIHFYTLSSFIFVYLYCFLASSSI